MNWRRGLERVSAVAWGAGALFYAGIGLATFVDGHQSNFRWLGFALVSVVAALLFHRITCWIIGGFFAPKGS